MTDPQPAAGNRDREDAGHRQGFSWRTPVAVVLIVLGCVLAPVSVLGVWAGYQVSDTGRWVATVEPLIHDPAVQNLLTDTIADQITSRLNVTGAVDGAASQLDSKGLSRVGSLLTSYGPEISSAVSGYIHNAVHSVITSRAMATAWVQVNKAAHKSLIHALSGQDEGTITTNGGQIVLHIGPLINVVKQALVERGFSLVNSIPEIDPTVTLFQSDDLARAQAGYRLLVNLKIVLPIVAVVLLAGGVLVARGRRRALVGAALGLAASMVILAIILAIARSIYLGSVPSTVLPSDAAADVFDAFVHFIKISLRVLLAVGLVIAIGAYFTGSARAAVQTRSVIRSGLNRVRSAAERRGVATGPVGEWTYRHRRILRVAAVALMALIFVFWGEPTALVVIVLVIIALVLLGLIELIGRSAAEPEAAGQT